MTQASHGIDASRIEEAISMLEQYISSKEVAPLLAVLRDVSEDPGDEALLGRLSEVVDNYSVCCRAPC